MKLQLILRYGAALIAAALAPAFLFGATSGSLEIVPISFVVALGHAVLFGLPLGLWLQHKGRANFFTALMGGFAIGALPVGILTALGPNADYASIDNVPTVIHGARTSAGWMGILALSGGCGLLGALGGFSTWTVFRVSERWRLAPLLLAGCGVAAIGFVFAIPQITMDRSCHNVVRDGRTSIGPVFVAKVALSPAELPLLGEVLGKFSRDHHWSFRDDTRELSVPGLVVSACAEPGTAISVNEQLWPNVPAEIQGGGVSVAVYQPQGGDSWKVPARDLVTMMEARWPGRVTWTARRINRASRFSGKSAA